MKLIAVYIVILIVAALPAALARRRGMRMVAIYALAVLLPLIAFDGLVRLSDERGRAVVAVPANYWKFDEQIGRMPGNAGPYRVTATDVRSTDPVYSVSYTIGPHGFREDPSRAAGRPTVVFFGCSYTYGEGVEDNETFPARFSAQLNGEINAMNMGFSTYGPQQMLRMLETGYLPAHGIVDVVGAFYLAIPDHVNRAAGFYSWNQQSPRYAIDRSGTLAFQGLYRRSPLHRLVAMAERLGGGWALIGNAILAWVEPPEERLRLFASIVGRSGQIVHDEFKVPLVVILWDLAGGGYDPDLVAVMDAELQARDVRVVRVSDLVGAIPLAEIAIRPGVERHPNAGFHNLLGTSLARRWHAGTLVPPR